MPHGKSQAVGLYLLSSYLGGTVGGWLPQLPYERWGCGSTLGLVAGVLVASTLAATAAWRRPARA